MPYSKYNAEKTEFDGYVFDSKREATRYAELKLLEKVGEISKLEFQPKFEIKVNGKHIANYFADFRYIGKVEGEITQVIEDTKGVRTPVYKLKKKLVEAIYGITITEIS